MIVTTTPNVEGKEIMEYLGVVTGHSRQLVAGTMRGYIFSDEYCSAMKQLRSTAEGMRADAVVGIRVNVTNTGGEVETSVYGTAVKLADAGYRDELPDF